MNKTWWENLVIPLGVYLFMLVVLFTGLRPYEGGDGLSEIWRTTYTIKNGWDWTVPDHNNASLVLTVIAPYISKTLHINPLNIFRDIFPFIFASTSVMLYFLFRRIISPGRACFAAVFFAVLPPTYQEIPNIAKSMVAQPFAVGSLLVLFSGIRPSIRIPIGSLLILATAVNHYTIGIMLFIWLGFSVLVTRKKEFAIAVSVTGIMVLGYFYIAGGGAIVRSFVNIGAVPDHRSDNVVKALKGEKFETYSTITDATNPPMTSAITNTSAVISPVSQSPKTILTTLKLYYPLKLPVRIPYQVRTLAIYLATVVLFAGGLYWLFHKKYLIEHKELSAMIAFSTVSVILAMYVPYLTRGLYLSRWVQLAGIPMCGLYGMATHWLPRKISYPVASLILVLLLVLVR